MAIAPVSSVVVTSQDTAVGLVARIGGKNGIAGTTRDCKSVTTRKENAAVAIIKVSCGLALGPVVSAVAGGSIGACCRVVSPVLISWFLLIHGPFSPHSSVLSCGARVA